MVIPIMGYLGIEPVIGEAFEGEQIPPGVIDRIRESDAFIGFLTQRGDPDQQGVYRTHDWVQTEIGAAVMAPLDKVLTVREVGIDDQGGLGGNRQWMVYEESKRAEFLVELVGVLRRWAGGIDVTLRVTPDDVAKELADYVDRSAADCTYRVKKGGRTSPPRPATISVETGGPTIWAGGIPQSTMVGFQVEAAGMTWTSSYMSVESLDVELRKVR
ncbi:MAG: hypothetical protein QOD71_1054 [Thermoleophilaceae bacterium]|nr:hypothetical protein [Thermoleophilaceae bacterium]